MFELILTAFAALKADRRGVTAIEYGMIAALIAVVIAAAVAAVGTKLSSTFTSVSSSI